MNFVNVVIYLLHVLILCNIIIWKKSYKEKVNLYAKVNYMSFIMLALQVMLCKLYTEIFIFGVERQGYMM